MVFRMGFGPTTFRLGGGRSIQLSYGDTVLHPWGRKPQKYSTIL